MPRIIIQGIFTEKYYFYAKYLPTIFRDIHNISCFFILAHFENFI